MRFTSRQLLILLLIPLLLLSACTQEEIPLAPLPSEQETVPFVEESVVEPQTQEPASKTGEDAPPYVEPEVIRISEIKYVYVERDDGLFDKHTCEFGDFDHMQYWVSELWGEAFPQFEIMRQGNSDRGNILVYLDSDLPDSFSHYLSLAVTLRGNFLLHDDIYVFEQGVPLQCEYTDDTGKLVEEARSMAYSKYTYTRPIEELSKVIQSLPYVYKPQEPYPWLWSSYPFPLTDEEREIVEFIDQLVCRNPYILGPLFVTGASVHNTTGYTWVCGYESNGFDNIYAPELAPFTDYLQDYEYLGQNLYVREHVEQTQAILFNENFQLEETDVIKYLPGLDCYTEWGYSLYVTYCPVILEYESNGDLLDVTFVLITDDTLWAHANVEVDVEALWTMCETELDRFHITLRRQPEGSPASFSVVSTIQYEEGLH